MQTLFQWQQEGKSFSPTQAILLIFPLCLKTLPPHEIVTINPLQQISYYLSEPCKQNTPLLLPWSRHHQSRSNTKAALTLVTSSTCDLQAVPSFQQLHVVGGEHSIGAVGGEALPPACVNLVNVGDDVVRVKGNLCVISCNTKPKFPQTCISLNVSVVTVNLSIITLTKY